MKTISISKPIIDKEEIAAVKRVLASGTITQGPEVAALEASFASYCGTKYAVAVNSGTAAIHCALLSLGIGFGDEVITSSFSFIATINPILMCGARPVLVDIYAEDFNLNIQQVAAAITPATKAVLAVDLYGQAFDVGALKRMCDERGIALIEDACQAIGATYGKKRAGNFGKVGCFSFYATKNIMSAEGGMLTTNNPKIAEAARRLRQHGMTAQYEYDGMGYNYRMPDILAAIGRAQLAKVEDILARRRQNACMLDNGLKNIPGLITPIALPGRGHVYHQYIVRVQPEFGLKRNELARQLKECGISTGIYYPKPLHHYPHIAALGYVLESFPEARRAATEVLALPVHPLVTKGDITRIVTAIQELANG